MKTRWQFSLRSLLLICIALTVVGVIGQRVYLRFFPPPIVVLCGFDDRDIITGWHLKRLLEREGVHYELRHTSDLKGWHRQHMLCGIDARTHDRVLRLLESAVQADQPTVTLTDDGRDVPWLHGDDRDAFEQTYDRPLGDILKNDPPSDFTRILQAVVKSERSDLSGDDTKVIHQLSGLRRWILQPNGKLAPAFEASVEFPAERPMPTARHLIARVEKYYFFDDFREVSVSWPAGEIRYPLTDEMAAADKKQAELEGRLHTVMSGLDQATRVSLYGGLPHSLVAEDKFIAAKKKYQTAEFAGEWFYAPALALDGADVEKLFDLCSDKQAYRHRESDEDKLCGGFHPDFAVEFSHGEEALRVLICFGCREVKILGPEGEVYADLTKEAALKWEPILREVGKKLPPPTARE